LLNGFFIWIFFVDAYKHDIGKSKISL
jgi:hypothetical protein